MKKYLFHILILITSAICLSSCDDKDEPTLPNTIASRTVLVYMLSTNNGLGAMAPHDYDIQDINEMLKAAKNGDIGTGRLIIYHSSSNGKRLLKEITPHGVDTLKAYNDEVLSQSKTRMSEVINDVKALAPAEDYGLVLWGHGSGWIQDGISEDDDVEDIAPLSFGSEQKGKYKMNVTSLAEVINDAGFSFIYMDCCYMSSVEVIYQLRHATPIIVAYPTEVLGWGMPYDENVKCFFAETPDMVQAAKNTYNYYVREALSIGYEMCTVAVLNTAGMDRLAAATKAIYDNNTTGLHSGFQPQAYSVDYNCQYFDFGSYVRSLQYEQALIDEYNEALSDVVTYENATKQIWGSLSIDNHSGLSTYILKNNSDISNHNYYELDWYKDVASSLVK